VGFFAIRGDQRFAKKIVPVIISQGQTMRSPRPGKLWENAVASDPVATMVSAGVM
jgi:hypothetical protein